MLSQVKKQNHTIPTPLPLLEMESHPIKIMVVETMIE